MKSANRPPRRPGHNVVKLVTRKNAAQEAVQESAQESTQDPVAALAAQTRSKRKPDDARVKEAMRLAQAFLAIEDPVARGALVALAERLISYDWIRKVK